jgi:hypothetical protein
LITTERRILIITPSAMRRIGLEGIYPQKQHPMLPQDSSVSIEQEMSGLRKERKGEGRASLKEKLE